MILYRYPCKLGILKLISIGKSRITDNNYITFFNILHGRLLVKDIACSAVKPHVDNGHTESILYLFRIDSECEIGIADKNDLRLVY